MSISDHRQRAPEAMLRKNLKSQQRREAKHIVFKFAHGDPIRAELVNLLTPEQAMQHPQVNYAQVYVDLSQYKRGEVLIDSKGKGTLQQ